MADVLWATNNPGVQAIHSPCHRSGRTMTNWTSAHTGTSKPRNTRCLLFPPVFWQDSVNHLVPSPQREMARPAVSSDHGSWHKENLLFIQDCLSGQNFLINTGAQVSVLPATNSDTHSGHWGPVLTAANSNAIRHFWQAYLAAKGQIATFPVGIHPCQHFPCDSWSRFPVHQLDLGQPQGPVAH